MEPFENPRWTGAFLIYLKSDNKSAIAKQYHATKTGEFDYEALEKAISQEGKDD